MTLSDDLYKLGDRAKEAEQKVHMLSRRLMRTSIRQRPIWRRRSTTPGRPLTRRQRSCAKRDGVPGQAIQMVG